MIDDSEQAGMSDSEYQRLMEETSGITFLHMIGDVIKFITFAVVGLSLFVIGLLIITAIIMSPLIIASAFLGQTAIGALVSMAALAALLAVMVAVAGAGRR